MNIAYGHWLNAPVETLQRHLNEFTTMCLLRWYLSSIPQLYAQNVVVMLCDILH